MFESNQKKIGKCIDIILFCLKSAKKKLYLKSSTLKPHFYFN